LGSLYFLRFYESELVRNTEGELIAQAAFISAIYRSLNENNYSDQGQNDKIGSQVSAYDKARDLLRESSYYTPIIPRLDLTVEKVLPRRPEAKITALSATHVDKQSGEKLQPILLNAQRFTLAGMRVLDQQGIVIAGKYERGLSLADVSEVKQALKGHYTAVIRERISNDPRPPIASISRGANIRVFIAFPIVYQNQVQGVVYLSRTPKGILKHIYENKIKLIVFAVLMLVITRLLVIFLSTRISRPIRQLIQEVKKVTDGKMQTVTRLNKPGTYEIAKLSENFSTMSQTVHQRSNYIREFASHVSHEFKTPLTSLQGTAEILLDHFDDVPKEKREHFLNNLLADSKRLEKLVERLLEMARADARQPSHDRIVLYPILRNLAARYQHKSLTINYQTVPKKLQLTIANDALQTVLINLFENSLQHEATTINVSGDYVALKKQFILTIQDNGTGISPANRQKVFTPFFTTRRENGGTGLGLGIIASLLNHWQAEIRLGESEQGALFELVFQLAEHD
ncbi:MAG TPA: HAMP domain-containing protein, partial [Thiothrix sp.]|nr:HAMP domain-containing protein [Thiothrix sp.]